MKGPTATNANVRKAMQGNKRKDTSIEIMFRKALWRRGVRYRKNCKNILGTPDVAIKKYRLAVFCDGDFWHGRAYRGVKSHEEYWNEKIKRNQERDLEYTIRLRDAGWIVLRFWESEIRDNLDGCVTSVIDAIQRQKEGRKQLLMR